MSGAIAKRETVTAELAKAAEQYGPAALAALGPVQKAVALADGIKAVRALVRQCGDTLMSLQGTALGFRTDKDREGGYQPDVVIECATEAMLRGLRWTGNEFNIIQGRCYGAKDGLRRLVGEFPGLTDLEMNPGVPTGKDGGAIVTYSASWRLDGNKMSLTRVIPVKVTPGQGADAILGKAARKMYAAILERLTGSPVSEGDIDDPPILPPAPPKTEGIRDRLTAGRPEAGDPPPAGGALFNTGAGDREGMDAVKG